MRKHRGTAVDDKNCEFHYVCLISDESTIYFCEEFPEIEANSLKELKKLMSEK